MLNLVADNSYALFATGANKKIISELQNLGAEMILFPLIQTKIVSNAKTEKILTECSNFDWLIFTDIYAVEFFLQRLAELNVDFFELDSLRVCAFGESVADRLRFSQLHADLITNSIRTSDVFQALREYLLPESEFENLSFLVLSEEKAKAEIGDELKKLTAEVVDLPIYQVEIEDNAKFARLKALLKGGAVDEFIFSSPFDVINLAHIFQTEQLDEVLAEIKLTATDQMTRQTLQEFRLI